MIHQVTGCQYKYKPDATYKYKPYATCKYKHYATLPKVAQETRCQYNV